MLCRLFAAAGESAAGNNPKLLNCSCKWSPSLDNSMFAVPDHHERQQGFSLATSDLLLYIHQQA